MPATPDEKRLNELEAKWLNGTITEAEAQEYADWYNQGQDQPVPVPEALASSQEAHRLKLLAAINSQRKRKAPVTVRFLRVAAVAALLAAVVVGILINRKKNNSASRPVAQTTPPPSPTDIAPGTTRATLTLSNGKTIVLDPNNNNLLEQDNGVTITGKDSTLTYTGGSSNAAVVYNTLHTASGEQYSITLSDGTKVWLNAATRLHFPTRFTGNERKVEVNGEAYFEVAKNKAMPFRVTAGKMTIEVLGTHFNVNAYDNEDRSRVTLLEGKVEVSGQRSDVGSQRPEVGGRRSEVGRQASVTLQPGEQAVAVHSPLAIDHSPFTIDHSPDVDAVMAWKNGAFSFNDADITTVMRQLERWYNIEAVYEGKKPSYLFSGGIPRNATLMEVLRILEVSKVRFQLQGRKLIVLP